jgi:hypothetical protein
VDLTTDQLSQYGPVGLLIAAAIVAVRAYLASGSTSVWKFLLNSFLKSPPTRAEAYALHGASSAGLVEPALKLIKALEAVLTKVAPTPPTPPEPPKEVPK